MPRHDGTAGLPDAQPVLDLLNGFRRSKVLFTLVSLHVLELIGDQQLTLQQLAGALGSRIGREPSLDGLQRLLDAGVSLDLLSGSASHGYMLTGVAQTYLVPQSEYSLTGYIQHSNDVLYKLWGDLDNSVVTGGNCWQQAFGLDGGDVFASMYSSDAALLRFLHGMHSFAKLSSMALLTAFDLSPYRTMVDLGGASGALAGAACQLHPAMRAVVVDLPHVIAKAQEHFTKPPYVSDSRTLQRLSWVAADFFAGHEQHREGQQQEKQQQGQQQRQAGQQQQEGNAKQQDMLEQVTVQAQQGQEQLEAQGWHGEPEQAKGGGLPAGDLYVLARILHDWDDQRCLQLLRRVHDRLTPGGAILVCEMLLDECGTSPSDALLQSLNMLTQTHGRERKLSEFRQLLEAAGFSGVEGKRTGAGLDAVFAVKRRSGSVADSEQVPQ